MCPEALAALAIDAIAVPHPTRDLPIPLATMQEHYQTAVKAWLVAKRLGRSTMEQASKFLLELLTFAALYKYQKRPRFTVRDDDVLQTMGRHIVNIKTWCLSIGDTKYISNLPQPSTSTSTSISNLPQPSTSTSTSTSIFNPPQPSRRNPASLPVLAPDASRQEDQECESDGEGGDSDPDYQQQGDFSSYFEDPHPANDRQRWLAGFYIYLNTPDCGRKRNKNRRQMLKILEDLDPRGSDINILSRDEGYIVWTHWVDPKMEELSGGTIRSYLGTYEMFLNYVTMERVRLGQVSDLPGDVTLVLRTTIKKLKGWRRTVDLETRPQRNRKRLEDCDFRLTNDDVDAFRSSSVMVNASRLPESAQQRHLTMPELCLVRDMMIAELTIQTGTRPGALANATIHDFQTVKQDQRTKMRVMLVPERPSLMSSKT